MEEISTLNFSRWNDDVGEEIKDEVDAMINKYNELLRYFKTALAKMEKELKSDGGY